MNTSRKQKWCGYSRHRSGNSCLPVIKVGALSNVGKEIGMEITLGDAAGLTEGAAVRSPESSWTGPPWASTTTGTVVFPSPNQPRSKGRTGIDASILGRSTWRSPKSADAPLVNGASLAVTLLRRNRRLVIAGPSVSAIESRDIKWNTSEGALEKDRIESPGCWRTSTPSLVMVHRQSWTGIGHPINLSSVRQVRQRYSYPSPAHPKNHGSVDTPPRMFKATGDLRGHGGRCRNMVKDNHALMQNSNVRPRKSRSYSTTYREIDKWELRRLLREGSWFVQGIVDPPDQRDNIFAQFGLGSMAQQAVDVSEIGHVRLTSS